MSTTSKGTRATIRLTPKAREIFDETVQKFSTKLRNEFRYIDIILSDIGEHFVIDSAQAIVYKTELNSHLNKYHELSLQYTAYLKSVKSQESLCEQSSHDLVAKSVFQKVTSTVSYLNSIIEKSQQNTDEQLAVPPEGPFDQLKNVPSLTKSELFDIIPPPESFTEESEVPPPEPFTEKSETKLTRNSRASSMLARQRAKLEAAKTREKYAQKEIELIQKQTLIQADIKLLNVKREVEEAECELRAMSEVLDEDRSISEVSAKDIQRRTAEFILTNGAPQNDNTGTHKSVDKSNQNVNTYHASPACAIEQDKHQVGEKSYPINTNLNVHAPQFKPTQPNVPSIYSNQHQLNACKELSQFIVKKDLLLSRLTKYDDTPGYFLAWKASFKSVMCDLNVTPSEEIDLLVKWLGPESSKQALSIRAASAANPVNGVKRIWARLEDRFGSPEIVESSLRKKLENFGKINNKDHKRLFELVDIVDEIEAVKENDVYKTLFSVFDSSAGVNRIVSKLPYNIQEKWTSEANRYKLNNNMKYPHFTVFAQFLQKIAKMKNDPSFFYEENRETKTPRNSQFGQIGKQRSLQLSCARTDTSSVDTDVKIECPLHGTNHTLNACRAFRIKPISERKDFLKSKGLCFRCCGQKRHLRKDCKEQIKCTVCQSVDHPTAMHLESGYQKHEGEVGKKDIRTSCTQICGTMSTSGKGKSCAKIILVKVYPKDEPMKSKKMYCLIDDQSNRSLATSHFFNMFQDNGPEIEYVLSSCAGKITTSGRLATGYVIESYDGNCSFNLPTLIECNDIPDNRDEIASPNIAMQYTYLENIAPFIPEIDNSAQIDLLIGRDLISAHHVLDQRVGNDNLPYAQQLPLGWVIIGEVCLGKVHQSDYVCVNKTTILSKGRTSLMKPCQSEMLISNIFHTTEHDEKIGSSIEDDQFLKVMESGFVKDSDNNWVAPLPFREGHTRLDNNRPLALNRAKSLDYNLKSNPTKKDHVVQFMQKLMDNGHAEVAPPIPKETECWYLPMFGVYHPRKPDSVRVVFDASAIYNNNSLNKVLLKGPDLTNSLLGILLRFRKEAIAITADIEQMFYNFRVREEHRDYLRFIWHSENDTAKPLRDFRMTVHVFGNGPSPSIATYGLRKSIETADEDVQNFVTQNFYVDDGLISCQNVTEAVSLVKRTQEALLNGGNLRMHKIASNCKDVLDQFCVDDLAKNLKDVKFETEDLPIQRSLGMAWDINVDCFTFQLSNDMKPFTKRGVLSTINGLFDPVGFTSPVLITGKLLVR